LTKKSKGNVWLPLLITALGLSAVGVAATGLMRRPHTVSTTLDTQQNQPNLIRGRGYVNRGRLAPRLTMNLNALGDHLERPGKERLTITGELRSSSDSEARKIAATLEFPDKLQLGIQNSRQKHLLTFDGQEVKGRAGSDELDLIESLAYDSAEHFF